MTRNESALRVVSILLTAAVLAVAAAIAFGGVFVLPDFRKLFAEMGSQLPAVTQLVLGIPTWLYVLGASLVAGGVVINEVVVGRPSIRLGINLAVLLLLLGIVPLGVFAVVAPMTAMLKSMQGQ